MGLITYLCGGINGLSDTDCRDWREVAKSLLFTDTFDPMRRDYRGREEACVDEIVQKDLIDIRNSTFVLVNATRPSWGTAMEIVYASKWGLGIVAFVGESKVSPWLRFHCKIHKEIEAAIDNINEWAIEAGTQYTGKVSDHARFGCYFPR